MIVTIDGPAGAGKSTAARALARRLDFEFLDTGAMYRAVAWAGRQAGADLTSEEAIVGLLAGFQLEMRGSRVIVNGQDITALIRTPEITALSKPVADSPAARKHLSEIQRRFAADRNLVTEGRDQGTVVFPDAGCKFFLVARADERARRRYGQLSAAGQSLSFDEVVRAQAERDARDATRRIAPMQPAADAVLVDSTLLSAEQVVDLMERIVRERWHQGTARD